MVRDSWAAVRELIWPVSCAGCDLPGVPLCTRCRNAVRGPGFCTPVVGWPLGFEAWAACGYRGPAARLVNAWKERGRGDLTAPLGLGLAAAVRACRQAHRDPWEQWLMVPVPTRAGARRRRGSDLLADLALAAAEACRPGWPGPAPIVLSALRHVRRVRDQAELGASGRRANLRGALAVRPAALEQLAGRSCLVVDDVITTGTTAAEAARALTAAGARVVGACFLSVTLRRQGVLEPCSGTNLSE